MKKLIFLFTLILCCFNAYADSTNFDFYLGRYFVDKDEDIKVHFKYDLENFNESSFLVRPVIENGLVEIYNAGNNSWANSSSVLPELPVLSKEMVIKIRGFEIEKTTLYFQIFNTSTGEIYTTPKKTIWSKKIYSKYLEKVNERILGNVISKKDSEFNDVKYLESAQISPSSSTRVSFLNSIIDKLSQEYFYLIPLFVFATSFLIAFKNNSKKSGLKKSLDIENRIYSVDGKIH